MTSKKLEMVFLTDQGKNFSLSLNDPKEDLEEADIKEAMEEILVQDVFEKDKRPLEKISKARFVSRTVEEVF